MLRAMLIDLHVHIWCADLNVSRLGDLPPEYLSLFAAGFLQSSLDRGFTTLRDAGGTDAGYAALKSVVTKDKADDMESFVLAETFKYYYLLYAGSDALGKGVVVLNTEAHPLRPVAPAP